VSSDHEARLLAGAHDLADLEELADDAVRILGRGRAAGLDPAATGGLVTAATALGASPGDVFSAGRLHRAYPSDREFLEELSLAEEDIGDRAAAVSRQQELVTIALDAALADVGIKGRDAEARIELCEEAAGILDALAPRLRLALARVRAVPADLGETYEAAYDLVRRGGVLPRRGRWITGEDPSGRPARARLPRRRDMLPDLAPGVAAAAAAGLPAWLAVHGWEREADHRGCQVWRLRDQARVLIPPAGQRYDDTTDLVTTAINTIARHAGTPPRAVLSGATAMAPPPPAARPARATPAAASVVHDIPGLLQDAGRAQEIKRQVCEMHAADGLEPHEVLVHADGAITIDRHLKYPQAKPVTGVLRWKPADGQAAP
jgi:hypothetical protein